MPAVRTETSTAAEYGMTSATAVEVCQPRGEREYLQRLRCPDGTPPQFSRQGSGGSRTAPASPADEKKMFEQMFREGPLQPGEPDYHIVDFYEVRCGSRSTRIIMDMYHCHQPPPSAAPPGFTIEPQR